jgi:transcriptional regulator with XRE-family HTH domain
MAIGVYHKKLKAARMKAGLSVPELAEKAGVTPKTINRYESGSGHPNSRNAFMVRVALGVPWDSIFYFESEQ